MTKALLVLALVGFTGSAFAKDVQKVKTATGTVETSTDKSHNPLTGTDTTTKEVTVKNAATNEESSRKTEVKKDEHGKMIKKTVEEETSKSH